LDDISIITCMTYVDLNPIRAGLAAMPEDSDFTSIQQRIRAWQKENMPTAPAQSSQVILAGGDSSAENWLCPIKSDSQRRGILSISEEQYFDLVDKSGRELRSRKRGSINPDLAPILLRIGAKPEAWLDTITRFEEKFRVAAGTHSNLKKFADKIGVRWLFGGPKARSAFI